MVDYYRKYIEHPDYVPEGLEGQFDLRAGAGKGRIYRVSYQGRPLETTKPELQGAESRQLVQTLAHPNMWWRITAQRLLVERQDESALPSLRKLLLSAESPESRIHGLWSLEGLGGLEPDLLLEALVDEDPGVREHAVRLSEQVESASVRAKLLDLLEDPDDRVQFQLACTLGLLPEADSFPALTQILNRHQENRWFQIAVLTSAAENAGRWFQTIIRDRAYLSSDSEGKRELLSRITTILGARHLESEIATVLDFVTDATDAPSDWWRSASLAGLGLGLGQAGSSKLSLAPRTERSLFQLIGSPSPEVAEAALDLADLVRLANSQGLRRLIRDAVTTSESAPKGISRVNAVRIMALDPTESTIPVLDQLLGPQEPSEIQTAAAKSLLQQGHPQSVPLLLGKWKSYTEPVRKVVWEGFLAREDFLKELLESIADETVPAWTVSRPRANQLLQSADESVRRQAETLFADLSQNRQALIERYQPALSVKGTVSKGRDVFRQNCSRCHKLDEMGSEVGPDLADVIGRRPKGFFLTKVLDPNLNISPGYETYIIETRGGATVTGVIAQESPTSMILRREEGEEETVLRSSINSLRVSSVSTMPEGLEEEIDLKAMADLLEYLQRLGTPGPL